MTKRIVPGPGQESVWDYPRPPRLEPSSRSIKVVFAGEIVAASTRCYRVLETSHPPVWYIPREDVVLSALQAANKTSFCEFKGACSYWHLHLAGRSSAFAAWSYENPALSFAPIRGFLSFYANRVDACFVDQEQVKAQAGDFYGGWITSEIAGPFKGGPGTYGW